MLFGKEKVYIRAYTVGPYGDKYYGYIVEKWQDQVWFQLDSEKFASMMYKNHVIEDDRSRMSDLERED